jgi:predicted small secreted protein
MLDRENIPMRRPVTSRAVALNVDAEWTQRALATLLLLTALGLGLALGGCNTVAGMGQDLRAAGQALTGSADQTKQQM